MNPWYLFLKFLILIIFGGRSSSSEGFYGTCANGSFTCGTVSGFGYPFRRHQDPAHCGYPGFELNCDQPNPPTIHITDTTYRVLSVDSATQTLRIVREDMVNSICPEELANTSINQELFEYSSSYMNISLLFGCPISFSFMGSLGSAFSGNDEVFMLPGIQGPGICKTSVIIQVPAGFMDPSRLGEVLNQGFEVRWKVESRPCTDCTQSGGQCIYDKGTSLTTCACLQPPLSAATCSAVNKTTASLSTLTPGMHVFQSYFETFF